MDDGRLIEAMARGDLLALATFYDRYASLVLGLAVRVTGNAADAEEVHGACCEMFSRTPTARSSAQSAEPP